MTLTVSKTNALRLRLPGAVEDKECTNTQILDLRHLSRVDSVTNFLLTEEKQCMCLKVGSLFGPITHLRMILCLNFTFSVHKNIPLSAFFLVVLLFLLLLFLKERKMEFIMFCLS